MAVGSGLVLFLRGTEQPPGGGVASFLVPGCVKMRGTFLRSIWESILGSPYFGKLRFCAVVTRHVLAFLRVFWGPGYKDPIWGSKFPRP